MRGGCVRRMFVHMHISKIMFRTSLSQLTPVVKIPADSVHCLCKVQTRVFFASALTPAKHTCLTDSVYTGL